MATAPPPGSARRAQTERAALRISIKGETRDLVFADLGPRDARMFRKATGMALRTVLDEEQFDLDSIAALWWLARIRSGDKVTYDEVEAAFPSYADMDDETFSIEELTPEDDGSPEA